MTEIMNPSINDSSGSWGLAETIEYESSNLFNLKIDLNMANFYLDEIKAQIVIMESFDSQWEGAAKDAYVDLKTLLQKYCNDYQVSVQNLKACVSGLDTLINDIPSADVIKEIDNA